ncbi:MAG: flagellar basal body-associated FliL family protein [Pseudomonadota bacterium]|mgnify:CR=1 FL=1
MAKKNDLNLGNDDDLPGGESGGKSKLIIIIAAVVVLAGGGAAAFFFMSGSGEETEASVEEVVEEVDQEPLYADVKKLLVNLEHGGRTHFVQAEMQLMSYSQDVINQAYRDMPAIRDRLIILFNSQDFAALKTVEGKEQLRAAALVTVNEALGLAAPDVVEEIYFENFVLQ